MPSVRRTYLSPTHGIGLSLHLWAAKEGNSVVARLDGFFYVGRYTAVHYSQPSIDPIQFVATLFVDFFFRRFINLI